VALTPKEGIMTNSEYDPPIQVRGARGRRSGPDSVATDKDTDPLTESSRPDEIEMLIAEVDWDYTDSAVRSVIHAEKANLWDQRAKYVSWLSAVLATASALTVVAEYKWAAAGLAVAAAIAAGFVAEIKPAAIAAESRKAASDYEDAANRLSAWLVKVYTAQRTIYIPAERTADGQAYDAGFYETRYELTRSQRDSLREEFQQIREKRRLIKADAPGVPDTLLRAQWAGFLQDGRSQGVAAEDRVPLAQPDS
jgi:hypothetical protein